MSFVQPFRLCRSILLQLVRSSIDLLLASIIFLIGMFVQYPILLYVI